MIFFCRTQGSCPLLLRQTVEEWGTILDPTRQKVDSLPAGVIEVIRANQLEITN
jgi:hypothetical protein